MTPPHPSHWLVAVEKSTQEDIAWNSDDHPPPGQSFDFWLSNNVFDQGCPISGVCVDWGTIPIKGYPPQPPNPPFMACPPNPKFFGSLLKRTLLSPPNKKFSTLFMHNIPLFVYFTGLVSNILHCVVDWSKCSYISLFLFFLLSGQPCWP